MLKSKLHLIVFVLLIISALSLSPNIPSARAWLGDITIQSDGSVVPPGAPITHVGSTYNLTSNVQGSINCQKDNIIINGMGNTIQGTGSSPYGLTLSSTTGVTITNFNIEGFVYGVYISSATRTTVFMINATGNSEGIYLMGSTSNIICKNRVDSSTYEGLYLSYCSNSIIFGNTIQNNSIDGLYLGHCSGNNVLGNKIEANSLGVFVDSSSNNNNVLGNNITSNNSEGVYCSSSSSDAIYHNNIANNSEQASSDSSNELWDFGYPSGGNYWSNYGGQDSNHDGLGDTPFVIDGNNSDRYPLMKPWFHIQSDLNFDGKVSLADLVMLASSYDLKLGDRNWDPLADVDGNGVIGLSDLVILALQYGQHFP